MLRLFLAFAVLIIATIPGNAAPLTILAFGDSLMAGYGLPPDQAFPVKLEAALRARGHDVLIVNGGVSGDTAADGLARLEWSLGDDVDGVIVELGANDALRGLPVQQAEQSLDALLAVLGKRGLPILLAGMLAPPNLGAGYASDFNAMYPALAEKHAALLYPFFLEGVAADPTLNQPDGLHPSAAGVDVIVAGILPHVEELLTKAATK